MKSKPTLYYKLMRGLARITHPRAKTVFEIPPDGEAAVFVCNHSHIHGPVMMTLDFPLTHKSWTVSYAMDKEVAVSYAYHDVLFGKSRRFKRFWLFLAHIVRIMLPPILACSDVIPVYHDKRIASTFRESVRELCGGCNIVIFGESPERYTEYVNRIQPGFVDLAKLYYRRTGKALKFYPVYAEKKNRLISVGTPITYDPEKDISEQRGEIAGYLSENIDRLARQMKPHKPVLFLPERWYGAYGEYEYDAVAYWKMIAEGKDLPGR